MKKSILCFLLLILFADILSAAAFHAYNTDSYEQDRPLEKKAWKLTAGDCVLYVLFYSKQEKLYIVINNELVAINDTSEYRPDPVCGIPFEFSYGNGYKVFFQRKNLSRYVISCSYPMDYEMMESRLEIIDEAEVPFFK